jgi:hypothetical protein
VSSKRGVGGDMNQKDSIIEQDCFVEKHLESVQ